MNNNVLLVGINAKYIHSNPAIRYIQKYARQRRRAFSIQEFTINQQKELIIHEIFKQKPDVLGFSCYIWNIELIKQIICDVKIVLPETVIVLGGPEISDELFGADYIIAGNGEDSFFEFVMALENGVKVEDTLEAFDFRQSVFPYDDEDFKALEGRIIYYESQRGCPFKCTYCLSSGGGGVCRLPIERVHRELMIFLDKKVKQVKFVDRTFNCDKEFRRNIWCFLIANDNGITNFHFEITAELLEDKDFKILKEARKSLFQFEIGIQTTCKKTLEEIERNSDFALISSNIGILSSLSNIHLHLDLIAGLPYENFESFRETFNDVFSLKPDKLQLGFLKVLKGSKMHKSAAIHGIKYSKYAPYEVLCTDALSYSELSEIKSVERMLEFFFNSGLATRSLSFYLSFFDSPFDLFHSLGQYWEKTGYGYIQHSKMKMYEHLLDFFEFKVGESEEDIRIVKEALIYDILINDNIKTFPERLNKPVTEEQNRFIAKLFTDTERLGRIDNRLLRFDKRQLKKQCSVVFFNYEVNKGFLKREMVIFFHYLSEKGRGVPCVLDWRS